MRPIDLAREHALSTQAVRNYEEAGAIPAAERSPSGYRRYTELHVRALRTFLVLREGYGHQAAIDLMRAANRNDLTGLYTRLDELHAGFLQERRTYVQVGSALGTLTTAPPPRHSTSPLTVGQLAHRLGIHPATLREWEKVGIVAPRRDRTTGYRVYGDTEIRDAYLAHYLRKGGVSLQQVATFVRELHRAGSTERMHTLLAEWGTRLAVRSRTALRGQARLDDYLTWLERAEPGRS
ncbi:MerR family transcriptional regulator [Nocardia transvalensis]|nr:MerR family transcriptional regulator [Nocardia transvalensis]